MNPCSNRRQTRPAVCSLVFGVALGLATTLAAAPADKPQQFSTIDPAVIAPAEQLSKAFRMVAAHVRPAVVSVYSEKTLKFVQPEFSSPDDFLQEMFGRRGAAQPHMREYRMLQHGMGSGIILDKQGHILTNFHVVDDVTEIKVQLADKRQYEAEIVGTDPQTDVAVIKIKGTLPDNLAVVTLGESTTLQPGELVMAIGAPFGLAQTVTEGIISATGRSNMGIEDYEDFLQTDAPINPGNSGGPLVNMHGEVIGMNTAIASTMGQSGGVGFAIPSHMIKTMLEKLMKGEKIERGQLGVSIQDLTRELVAQFRLSETRGALVAQVNKDSPAEKAGLEIGDVITRYDGHDVRDSNHLHNLVAETTPGTEVKIAINRKGQETNVVARISKREAPAGAMESPGGLHTLQAFGLMVQTLTPDLARQLGIEADKGVAITQVEEGSLAALAGLQTGDVITEADHQKVANTLQLNQVLAKAGDRVLLLIKRNGGSLFMVLQLK